MKLFCAAVVFFCVSLVRPQTTGGMTNPRSGMSTTRGSMTTGGMMMSGSGMMTTMSGMMRPKMPLSTLTHAKHGSGRSRYLQVKHHGIGSRVETSGGKMTISRNDDPTTDKNAIEFQPCEINELDMSGNKIGMGPNAGMMMSPNTHSFSMTMLMAKNASLGSPMNVTAGRGNTINTQKTSSRMMLGGGKMMDIDMSTYDSAGNVSAGAEEWEVSSGDIEMDFKLSNWTFCTNNCTGGPQMGSQLEMKFCMKSNKMPSKKTMAMRSRRMSGGAEEFDIGDSGNMVLSRQLWCDNAWVNMTTGYPMVQTNSMGGSYIVIRMPKFAMYCKWDPTIQSSTASDATVAALSLGSFFVALMTKLV